MSNTRNRDRDPKRDRKIDNTSNCESTCPGRKRRCPGEYSCPYQNNPNSSSPTSKGGDDRVTDNTPTKSTTIRVPPCALSGACPIVIQAPIDSKAPKTDLRIELYIHQLPPTGKDTQYIQQIDARVTNTNDPQLFRGRSNSAKSVENEETQENKSAQPNDETKISEVEVPSLKADEVKKNRTYVPPEDSEVSREKSVDEKSSPNQSLQENATDQPSGESNEKDNGLPTINLTSETDESSVLFSNNLEGSNKRSDGSIFDIGRSSQQNEDDQPSEVSRSVDIQTSTENSVLVGGQTENSPDNQTNFDQNNVQVEESIAVEEVRPLQNPPRRPSDDIKSQGSRNGSGKVDTTTDTEEDGNPFTRNSSARDMIDEATQASV